MTKQVKTARGKFSLSKMSVKERAKTRPTKQEIVYEGILMMIMGGKYGPGDKLNQEELATTLGVSITPVREALNRLASWGTIINNRQRGFVIPSYTREDVFDMLDLWSELRILAVRWTFERCSHLELQALAKEIRKLQPEIHRMANEGNSVEFRRLIFQSNYLTAAASGSRNLWECQKHLWIQHAIHLAYTREHMMRIADHRDIWLNAMEHGNKDEALSAVRKSLEISLSTALETLEKYASYHTV